MTWNIASFWAGNWSGSFMGITMGKQLNIRSDEAFELAHRLAIRERKTVAAVVVDALRRVQAMREVAYSFSPEAVAAREKWFREARVRFSSDIPKAVSSDHGDLYDENGLPI